MKLESTFSYPLTGYTSAWHEPLFNSFDCDSIIKAGHQHPFEDATVYTDSPGHKEDSIRRSRISPICNTPENSWIYQRLEGIVQRANLNKAWNFSISGFELIQFSEYKADYLGAFKEHLDILETSSNRVRKISVCVQLSPPEDYEGGELTLFNRGAVPKDRGHAVAFTSFYPHSVSPVTKGTRYSLVAWAVGPKFV